MCVEIDKILDSAKKGNQISKQDAVKLLEIRNNSQDFYNLLATSDYLSRTEYNNKGHIFAQIGINAEPCSKNCKFCAMGEDHFAMDGKWRKEPDEIIDEVNILINAGVEDLFLMTTADYPFEDYLEIGKKVRELLPGDAKLVANIGDFDLEAAKELKKAGFTGAYHIHRLREGIDTPINPETRINTLNSLKKAGLELYYCVEPIGPEHSYEEIATEMLRAKDYDVEVMAVMRRIPVTGTPFGSNEQITATELTKIAAVSRLVSRPGRAMNAHEVTPMSLVAGVNQLYAELGANPRDNNSHTESNRGCSIDSIRKLLLDAEYEV